MSTTKAASALACFNRKCQTCQSLTNPAHQSGHDGLAIIILLIIRNNPAMNQQAIASPKTRAEQETENEANRLREQVDAALIAVASRSSDEVESLRTAADRIERAARDLSDALRRLSQQRRAPDDL